MIIFSGSVAVCTPAHVHSAPVRGVSVIRSNSCDALARWDLFSFMGAGAQSVQALADYSGLCVVNRFTPAIHPLNPAKGNLMNSIVYVVGLIVIILFILGFFGLR
jgi:hypothetical protein